MRVKRVVVDDLYGGLGELEAITRTFVNDVSFFGERLDQTQPLEIDSKISAIHRAYVRAVFALIEGLLYQHQSLLLELAEAGVVNLNDKTVSKLREEKRFMNTKQKVQLICAAAGDAFQQKFGVDCDGSGWLALGKAIKLRNQITHPKSFADCGVQTWDLETIAEGERWFREMHNEYVRVAQAHYKKTRWNN